jgi:transglutaminase-like putative cysteine protease
MSVRILSRATAGATADGPSRALFYWLVSAFLLTLLPHVAQLPGWLTASILIAIVVRCVAEWRRWPLPTTASTGVVALCLLVAIFLQYQTILGRDAGTPFMAGLLTIKFYELRSSRDITLIIFSSFFVVMSALLFSQAIELFIYCLIMMWLLTGILLRNYMGDRADLALLRMLRASSVIFLQALPLALLLFFFLPRYSSRFQLSFNETVTGLSDHVDPGSVAKLADDNSPAMYVTIAGKAIPTDSMYWRAIVLWHFDGIAWTRGRISNKRDMILADRQAIQPRAAPNKGNTFEQAITLWPENQRWIPALDLPVTLARDAETNQDFGEALDGDVLAMLPPQVMDYKRRYKVTSASVLLPQKFDPEEQQAGTRLPPNINPRVRELADRLYAPNHDTTAYIHAVFKYFHDQNFQLSTEPGRLGVDPVGEFLFQTKTGFCEHYASAFGVLMRLEGIPCRMVLGYRGGDWDPYGNFYMICQSNAHAWNEVWMSKQSRWQRWDATNSVTAGSSAALAANAGLASAGDDLSFDVAGSNFTLLSGNFLPRWARHGLREVVMRREEMEAQWDDWVFSYDPETQSHLAQALGFGRNGWLALLGICGSVAGLGAGAAAFLLARKRSLSPVERFYARFCRRMAQRGAPRAAWEGPLAYTERLKEKFPAQSRPIETAGMIVAEYRYAPGEKRPTGNLKALLQEVAEMK